MRQLLLGWLLLFNALIVSNSNAQEWREISKVLPEQNNNYDNYRFGCSIAMDGNYAVVGASGYNNNTGRAFVLKFNGDCWETLAILEASDGAEQNSFGGSVCISDNCIVVRGRNEHDTYAGGFYGVVYVFEKPLVGWANMTETAKLTSTDDFLGGNVRISGDNIVTGSVYRESLSAYVFTKPETGWISSTETAKLNTTKGSLGSFQGVKVEISGDCIIMGKTENDTSVYLFEKPIDGWVNMTESAMLYASDANMEDHFGYGLSISGNCVVVGAMEDDDNGTYSGSAYLFEKPIEGWGNMTETAKLKASDGNEYDCFGYSVGISENQIAIGVPNDYVMESQSGSVYVFSKPIDGWTNMTETAKLSASDGKSGEKLGYNVYISGEDIISSALYDNDNGKWSGSVYHFKKPAGAWKDATEHYEFFAYDNITEKYFNGNSVSVDGNYAVVGAYGNKNYTGCAYVLYFDGINWKTVATLTASDGEELDMFAYSVSIFDDEIVVGSHLSDKNENEINRGSAYVFKKPAAGWINMTETAKLIASDQYRDDRFGYSVSITNDYIVVGAYCDDDNGKNSGSVYIFEKPVDGWIDMNETAKLKASNGEVDDWFGYSLNASKETVIVGSQGNDVNGNRSGLSYIFQRPEGGWVNMTETAQLQASDNSADDCFGNCVNISGDYAIIGAYNDSVNAIRSGSAYVFKKPVDGWVNMCESAKLTASDGDFQDLFGCSVCISGNNIIISSINDNGQMGGSAYIFSKPASGWENMTETNKLIVPDRTVNDKLGVSVGISEDNVIIGASYDNTNGEKSGATYFFRRYSPYEYNDIICEGGDFIYSLLNPEIGSTFSWQENTGSSWVDITGETNDTLTISNVSLDMNGYKYRCIIFGTEVDMSDEATLSVNLIFNLAETGTVCSGDSYTFPDGTAENNVTSSVVHISNLQTVYGCDSIIETTVNVNPIYNLMETAVVNTGESYSFPDGKVQDNITSQVIYTSNLLTIYGCDSIIETTVNVDCNPVFNLSESDAICIGESYIFPDGTTQNNITSQVIHVSNLQTVYGCDSIIQTTVNVNPIYNLSETVLIKSGGSYTFPDGTVQNNITSQVIYSSNLLTFYGCDSIIETTVNVEQIQECHFTEEVAVCYGSDYLFLDGTLQSNITSQVIHESIIPSSLACDTIIETTVNVNHGDVTYLNETICEGETFQLGYAILSSSGLYGVTLTNQYGCDSLVNLDLIVIEIDVDLGWDKSIGINDTITLDAGENFETYYWNTEETSQTILIDSSYGVGSHTFSVQVTDENDCTETDNITITISDVTDIGFNDDLEGDIKLYPNPTSGKIIIDYDKELIIELYNLTGSKVLESNQKEIDISKLNNGTYIVIIKNNKNELLQKVKIIKE